MMIEAIVDAKYYLDNRYYENLPCGWSVSTLSQVTSSQLLNDGDWILSENMDPNGNVKLIQLGSIGLMRYIDKGFKYLTEDTFHKLSCTQIFPGYMLINRIISDKMYACILPQLEGKLITTVDTCWIAPKDEWYNLKYLMYFISSTVFQSIVLHVSSGTTRKRISKSDLIHLPIYLPPLSEQQRIISRVDELFEQIDIIEKNQADIDALYDEFRKRTLTLAIQGKLVPQNPNDEPASVLLERIRAKKKAKLGKKYVDSYIYKGDDNCYYEHIAGRAQDELVEVPFDIPYGWSWCRLAIFAQVLGGKRIPAGRQLTNENTWHYYIKVSDMKENTVCLDKLQFVPTDIYPTISRYIINKEDVYITVAGTIGRVGTIPNELDGANLTENADRIVVDEIDQHWLVKCLLSDVIQEQIKEATTKVGQPKLAIARIEKFLIPLPPLAEQKRIVAKINEIFAML